MKSNTLGEWFLLVSILCLAACPTIGHADEVAGVYRLAEINGQELPAVSWTFSRGEQDCRILVIQSTFLLGSDGKWAALLSEQDVCSAGDGPEVTEGPSRGILTGTYDISGTELELSYEGIVSLGAFSEEGGRLTLRTVGVGRYEGQSLEYVLEKD